jgi:hypothetical protein
MRRSSRRLDMRSPLVGITYKGELVALASARRAHIVAPWLAAKPPGDPHLRFVAHMCLCYGEVAAGRLDEPFSSELAERWARRALMDPALLATATAQRDDELASRWKVPVEQVRIARRELHGGD